MNIKTFVLSIMLSVSLMLLVFIGYRMYERHSFQPGLKKLSQENIAIIYCSHNNDGVKDAVDIVSKKLKADVIELKSAVAYPSDSAEFLKRIEQENSDISRVVLDNQLIDIAKYKLIVLATPVIQKQPCPVMQKFLNMNEARFNNKPVAVIVKYEKGGNASQTMQYFYYKLYRASKKPNFLTYSSDKKQLEHEFQIWFDEMKFTPKELK